MEIRTLPVGQLDTNCYIVWEADGRRWSSIRARRRGGFWTRRMPQACGVRAVLLTHVHFDHILAAREVMNATGAKLLVPAGDEPALTSPARSLLAMFLPGCRYDLQADRLLVDGDTVTVGGLTLTVMHTPGHTPGSSCYIGDGVIFSGDTLFAGGAGRTDFPGGDEAALRRSLKRLAALEGDYRVFPGHEESTTLQRERLENPYVNGFLRNNTQDGTE